jgi:hypothetical protein
MSDMREEEECGGGVAISPNQMEYFEHELGPFANDLSTSEMIGLSDKQSLELVNILVKWRERNAFGESDRVNPQQWQKELFERYIREKFGINCDNDEIIADLIHELGNLL